jgi:hypothetical protein
MGFIKSKLSIAMLIATLLCISASPCRSQSIDQLLEQLALDVEKLSELKTILRDMYSGYAVLDKGYTTIRDIVHGNFNLHKAFLDGLLAVSPDVRQYYRTASVIEMERRLITDCKASERTWIASGVFTAGELQYIHQHYSSVSGRGGKYLDRITMVLTAGELRMSDAERMQSIDAIYTELAGELQRLRGFNGELSIQVLQRQKENQQINLLKTVYGNQP